MKNFTNYKNDTYFITSKLKTKVCKVTKENFSEEEINAYILIALDFLYIKKLKKFDFYRFLENYVVSIAFGVLSIHSEDEKEIKMFIKKREYYLDKALQGTAL
jgi:hypothetical protein